VGMHIVQLDQRCSSDMCTHMCYVAPVVSCNRCTFFCQSIVHYLLQSPVRRKLCRMTKLSAGMPLLRPSPPAA
jgi:hypothetical protein